MTVAWRNGKSAALALTLALTCLLAMLGVEGLRWAQTPPTPGADTAAGLAAPRAEQPADAAQQVRLVERSRGRLPSPPDAPSAHASAIAALPNGDLLVYWWAGQRESAPDVRVFMSRFSGGRWSAPEVVVERDSLGTQIGYGVRRLGNPVPWVAPDGRVHLFVVATGLGGWAASRVVQLVSADEGRRFTALRVLPLSPLFNTSVLVRNSPVATVDGGWLLPAYFELGHKFGLLVSFDREGAPRWLTRMGRSTVALQPALLSASGAELLAVMRCHCKQQRLQLATSHDGGRNWEDQPDSDLINRDSAVAALRLADGSYVLAHNDMPAHSGSARQRLRLSVSADARHWVQSLEVHSGAPDEEFSYPTLQRVGTQLHLTYTDRREAIAHAVYDIVPGAPGGLP